MRDKIIRILWSEPAPLDLAMSMIGSQQPGLYYITRLWGSHETSLYIGKASRTIRERLEDHKKHWLHLYRGQILVRLGHIVYPTVFDAELLDHAESALIFEHGNILTDNTSKRNSYSYSELYRIENTGNIGDLKPSFRMHIHPDY